MKEKLTDELKDIFKSGISWVKYEVEYSKLTAAEKITLLGSAAAIAAIIMMLSLPILIMFSFALKALFNMIMSPALSYLSVAGVWILFILIIYLFKKKLISDPIAKFITRLFFEKKPK